MNCKHYHYGTCKLSDLECNNLSPISCGDFSKKETNKSYCKYCFNAHVYEPTDEELMDPFSTELTDENDGSSICIGHCHDKTRRFMINSGMGKPVNIEFDLWDNKSKQWHTAGRYYPKFCPECGRKLDEYDSNNR